jgi:hypothetical protein
MNPTPGPQGPQRTARPLSEEAKASLQKTHTLFRMFIVAVLGAFFVFQLDIAYLWLTALLTAAGIALGIIVLIRAIRFKESKLVLFGTISGLVVSAVHGSPGPDLGAVLQPGPRLPAVLPPGADQQGRHGVPGPAGELAAWTA